MPKREPPLPDDVFQSAKGHGTQTGKGLAEHISHVTLSDFQGIRQDSGMFQNLVSKYKMLGSTRKNPRFSPNLIPT